MTFADKIQAAKEKVTIPELWRILGFSGEPKCGAVNRCPWREDKHPSFSITADGRLFNDFTGGGGDVITFLEIACKLDRRSAMMKLIDIAGGGQAIANFVRQQKPARVYRRRQLPTMPELRRGTTVELIQLATLRGLTTTALELAQELDLLWFCQWEYTTCWVVTDSNRAVGQVRRLDGQPVNGVKAFTFPGSWAQWPIGSSNLHRTSNVALCEGGPDLLAAIQFIQSEQVNVTAVAMLGSSSISTGAVPLFHRKHVKIFRHNEKPKPVLQSGVWVTPDKSAGEVSANRWSSQLKPVAASVTIHQFPAGIKDLNDLAKADTNTRVMTYE